MKKLRPLACALFLALAVAACGNDEDTDKYLSPTVKKEVEVCHTYGFMAGYRWENSRTVGAICLVPAGMLPDFNPEQRRKLCYQKSPNDLFHMEEIPCSRQEKSKP